MTTKNHATYTVAQLLGNYLPGDLVNVNHALEFGLVILKPVNLYVFNTTYDFTEQTVVERLVNEGYAAPVVANGHEVPMTKLRLVSLDIGTPAHAHYVGLHSVYPWLLEVLAARSLDAEYHGHRLDEKVCLTHFVKAMRDSTAVQTPLGLQHVSDILSQMTRALEQGSDKVFFRRLLEDSDPNNFLDSTAMRIVRSSILAQAAAAAQRKSFQVMAVGGGEFGGFAYSVGLGANAGFELIAMGSDPGKLGSFVNVAGKHWIEKNFDPATCGIDLSLGHCRTAEGIVPLRCAYRDVSEVAGIFTDYVTHRVGEVKKVYQILLADENNLLPGEPGYDESFKQTL